MQADTGRPLLKKKDRIRRGRGNGSKGTYSGRGLKGQNARSGGGVRVGFEGGQNPQIKGLPMLRGFTNRFRVEYQIVNVARLETLPEGVADVTPSVLAQMHLVHHADRPVKILGVGDLTRALTVQAKKFSGTARAKIEAAGGTVKEG